MKEIKKGVQQEITLDQEGIPAEKEITVTVIGENGNILKDSDGQELKNKILTLSSITNKYSAFLVVNDNEPEQYIRLIFNSANVVILPQYRPEDALLKTNNPASYLQEVVPIQYFIDYVLATDSKLDYSYQQGVENFINNNRQGLKAYLDNAVNELENKATLYFAERTITDEKKDYFFDRFQIHLWQFAVNNPPLNDLVEFKLQYSANPIATIDKSLFVWDRLLGIIEFLPLPSGESAGLYTLLMSNISGLGLSILTGNLERIPLFFRVSYKTGLLYSGCDPTEKESIRQLISRRALINILPIIDPSIRITSKSESIDGVSSSNSYAGDRYIKMLKEAEDEYIHYLRKKYSRNVEMVIV